MQMRVRISRQAQSLYSEGNYQQAVDVCKQGIGAGGDDSAIANLYFYMGVSYIGLGNNASARDAFKKTVEYNPVFNVNQRLFPPDIAAMIRNARSELNGRLNISCEPVECSISINNKQVGSTLFSSMMGIGKYNVQAVPKIGTYKAVEGNVIVAYNKVTNVNIQLEPSGTSRQRVSTVSNLAGMDHVSAGNFPMGCDSSGCPPGSTPAYTIYLDSFYIDVNDVTVAQYKACVDAGVCKPAHQYTPEFEKDNNPVVGVTWIDAYNYCRWAGKRLPTEAQWEKAARGTTSGFIYPWGSSEPTTSFLNDDMVSKIYPHKFAGVLKL